MGSNLAHQKQVLFMVAVVDFFYYFLKGSLFEFLIFVSRKKRFTSLKSTTMFFWYFPTFLRKVQERFSQKFRFFDVFNFRKPFFKVQEFSRRDFWQREFVLKFLENCFLVFIIFRPHRVVI